jgi:hypothetical protein
MYSSKKYIKIDKVSFDIKSINTYLIGIMSLRTAELALFLILYIINMNIICANNTALSVKMPKKYKSPFYNHTDVYGGAIPLLTDNYKIIINDKYNRRMYLRKREDRYLL